MLSKQLFKTKYCICLEMTANLFFAFNQVLIEKIQCEFITVHH